MGQPTPSATRVPLRLLGLLLVLTSLLGNLLLAAGAPAARAVEDPVAANDASLPEPTAPEPALFAVAAQDLGSEATLETRRAPVEWSPAGDTEWQSVPERQTVRTGDRVRTGPGGAARIVYLEGTTTDLEANTGVLIQQLARTGTATAVASQNWAFTLVGLAPGAQAIVVLQTTVGFEVIQYLPAGLNGTTACQGTTQKPRHNMLDTGLQLRWQEKLVRSLGPGCEGEGLTTGATTE